MKSNISQARISQEIRAMRKENLPYLKAEPLDDDIYTWHFTFLGPQNSDFHEGLYHGQILLPFQYPFKPPDIIFMNKNGRFQVNTKICLTITQYHPQEWNSAWTIRTMLQAVISLFTQNVQGVGYEESNSQSRKFMAKQSQNYTCEKCGIMKNILKPRQQQKPQTTKKQQRQIKPQIHIQQGNYEYAPQPVRKVSQQQFPNSRQEQKITRVSSKYQGQLKSQYSIQNQIGQNLNNIERKFSEGRKRENYCLKHEQNNYNVPNSSNLYYAQQFFGARDIFCLNDKISKNRQLTKNILQSGKWLSGSKETQI